MKNCVGSELRTFPSISGLRWVARRRRSGKNTPNPWAFGACDPDRTLTAGPLGTNHMHIHNDHRTLSNAARLRDHAADVLRRLIEEREQFKRRLEETGKRDPMTVITGRSAVDAAILRTRSMIAEMDKLLVQMNRDLDDLESSRLAEPVAAGTA
jgi:hypothetical protein